MKLLRNVRLRPQASLGRRLKKTLLWPDAEVDNVPGAKRNLCYLSVLSRMKRAIPWKIKMNQEEDFVSIREPFSKHARKARGITNTIIFCDVCNKLLMTLVGLLIRLSLMTSLHFEKTRLLALTEFPTVSTGVLVVWVRSSSLMLTKLFWKGALSLIVLPKVGPFLSLRHLILMTLEGLFDIQTHFVH